MFNFVTATCFVVAVCGFWQFPLVTAQNEEGDHGDAEGYALPAMDDATLSAEITRIFQQDLLPNLKTGIPELRIQSIDPIRLPNYTLVNIDIPPVFRCASFVDDMIVNGLAEIAHSDIVINTTEKKLTMHFVFPTVEGTAGSGTNCYLFGFPLWRPRRGGKFEFRIDDFKLDGVFEFRPTPSEIVRLQSVDIDFAGAYSHGKGTLPPIIEIPVNFLQANFGRAFFRWFLNFGLSEVGVKVLNTFVESNAWQPFWEPFSNLDD